VSKWQKHNTSKRKCESLGHNTAGFLIGEQKMTNMHATAACGPMLLQFNFKDFRAL